MDYSDLLKNTIDFHLHPGPDPHPRVADAYEIAFLADRKRMKGLVLKHHDVSTVQLAELLKTKFPKLNVFGGLVLEGTAGGINPRAVEIAISSGAKIIWMPAVDAVNNLRLYQELKQKGQNCSQLLEGMVKRGSKYGLFSVLDGDKISQATGEVLELIKHHDVIVATGHMGPIERKIFVNEATKMGLKKIVITHVNSSWSFCTLEEQKELLKQGAFLEYCFLPLLPYIDNQDFSFVADSIKMLGFQQIILGTDLGASWATKGIALPNPIEGMAAFIGGLLNNGIPEEAIEKIASSNASSLLKI